MGSNDQMVCPECKGPLDPVNVRFQKVGYCRKDKKEFYQLPDGSMVDRATWTRIREDWA